MLRIFLSLLAAQAQSVCLPDGIPASQRKNLVRPGEDYPFGMYLAGWAAAFANSAVARLLLEEKLGFLAGILSG